MIGPTETLAASATAVAAALRGSSAVRHAAGTVGPTEDADLRACLLAHLPAARRVLAVGAHGEDFADDYLARHPGADWRCAAWDAAELRAAAPDCDLVVVAETRPLSASKHWRLVEIVERAK